jgi:carbon-monoxide dehydrogenase small subunit
MLLTTRDLLARNAGPTEAEVRHALDGNLCRCTGYEPVVASVLAAAEGAAR